MKERRSKMNSNPIFRLSELPCGCTAVVRSLPDNADKKTGLMRFGLICGTDIEAAFKAPCGDPCAYYFRGTLMAVRKKDADHIFVSYPDQKE